MQLLTGDAFEESKRLHPEKLHIDANIDWPSEKHILWWLDVAHRIKQEGHKCVPGMKDSNVLVYEFDERGNFIGEVHPFSLHPIRVLK